MTIKHHEGGALDAPPLSPAPVLAVARVKIAARSPDPARAIEAMTAQRVAFVDVGLVDDTHGDC